MDNNAIAETQQTVRDPIFGAAPLIAGESLAVYETFSARIFAAVKPADFLEEILAQDVLDASWEVRRMRRFKSTLLTDEVAIDLLFEIRTPDKNWAAQLIQRWKTNDPEAIKEIEAVFKTSTESLMVKSFARALDAFDRIDRMIAHAELRRNNALREVDRHRWSVAQALRRASEEAIDAEFSDVKPDQLAPTAAA